MANRPEDCNIVFLETNLDTRFLTLSHKDDTVLDFKNKLCNEHKLIFPHNGDIHVTALKIQREQQFYHMCDSMNLFSVFKGITTRDWFVFVDAVKDDSLPLAEKPKAVEKKTKKKKSKTLDERKTRKKHSASTYLCDVAAATNTSTYDESGEICEKVCVDAERLDDHNEAIKQDFEVGEKIDGVVAHQEKEVAVIPNDFFFGQKGYESLEKNGIKTGENQETFDKEKSISLNSEHVDYLRKVIKEADLENQEKNMIRALKFVDGFITSKYVNDFGPTQQGKKESGEGNISTSLSANDILQTVGSEPIGDKGSRKRKKSSSKDNQKTSRKHKKKKVTASQPQLDDNQVIALV